VWKKSHSFVTRTSARLRGVLYVSVAEPHYAVSLSAPELLLLACSTVTRRWSQNRSRAEP